MEIASVIIKPRLTEKTQTMKSFKNPKMAFVVNRKANKNQVAVAFKALFGIEPTSVNIINKKPSRARYMNKSRNNYHKAMKIALITVPGTEFENLQSQAMEEANKDKEKIVEVKDGN